MPLWPGWVPTLGAGPEGSGRRTPGCHRAGRRCHRGVRGAGALRGSHGMKPTSDRGLEFLLFGHGMSAELVPGRLIYHASSKRSEEVSFPVDLTLPLVCLSSTTNARIPVFGLGPRHSAPQDLNDICSAAVLTCFILASVSAVTARQEGPTGELSIQWMNQSRQELRYSQDRNCVTVQSICKRTNTT